MRTGGGFAGLGAGRPVKGCTGFRGDIGEGAVVVVVVEAVLAKVGDVEVGPTVIVVAADGYAEAPTVVLGPGFQATW